MTEEKEKDWSWRTLVVGFDWNDVKTKRQREENRKSLLVEKTKSLRPKSVFNMVIARVICPCSIIIGEFGESF